MLRHITAWRLCISEQQVRHKDTALQQLLMMSSLIGPHSWHFWHRYCLWSWVFVNSVWQVPECPAKAYGGKSDLSLQNVKRTFSVLNIIKWRLCVKFDYSSFNKKKLVKYISQEALYLIWLNLSDILITSNIGGFHMTTAVLSNAK